MPLSTLTIIELLSANGRQQLLNGEPLREKGIISKKTLASPLIGADQ